VTDLASARKLAMKVLGKSLDVKLAPEKIEMAVLTRENGETKIKLLGNDEVTTIYYLKINQINSILVENIDRCAHSG
jgi:hypothetical protein